MKQPKLGIKIVEIRNKKGITQKELSESCNIDIRTIQRIESGEVVPRMSTLKLIASVLGQEMSVFNRTGSNSSSFSNILIFSFLVGIVNFITYVLAVPLFPKNGLLASIYLPVETINALSGVLLYWGIYELGKYQENKILKVASVIVIICIPLYVISLFIPVPPLNTLLVSIIGMNSIVLGIGFLYSKSRFVWLYKIAGMIQILVGPFFIVPISISNVIGCWLSIPFFLALLTILYYEYRETKVSQLQMGAPIPDRI